MFFVIPVYCEWWVLHDVKLRIQLEQSESCKGVAVSQESALANLMSTSVHDMRTPVIAIQSGCQLLQLFHKQQKFSEMPKMFDLMDAAAKLGLCALDGFILTAKMLNNLEVEVEVEVGNFNVRLMLENTVKTYQLASYKSVKATCSLTVADNVPEEIKSSEQYLTRSLVNLLSNASQCTDKGSIRVTLICVMTRSICEFQSSIQVRGWTQPKLSKYGILLCRSLSMPG